MTTINIHKDKLLPAAFAYQQRVSQESQLLKLKFCDDWRTVAAIEKAEKDIVKEYIKLQTACRVAEDGIVSLDIDVVQRIFGEEYEDYNKEI